MGGEHRFQVAAGRAEAAVKHDDWSSLTPSARAAAIYRELRALDSQAAKSQKVYARGDLEREMSKAISRVRVNERRVTKQAERVAAMVQQEQNHSALAARIHLGALEARLELSRRRLHLLESVCLE